MEGWRFKPGSYGDYFLSATLVCSYLDSGLKGKHRVSRKLASHPLKKEGRAECLCPGCAPGRGGGQRGCSLCVASSEQRVLVSPIISEGKAGAREETPGRQKV